MKLSKLFTKTMIVTIGLSTLLTVGAYASSLNIVIDNDTAQGSAYSNPMNVPYGGFGFNTKLSRGYLGDSRITGSGNNDIYCWQYNGTKASSYWLYVYLNDAAFTDPNAKYQCAYTNESMSTYVGSIDQNTAASGWNYIGLADSGNYIPKVFLYTSRSSNGYSTGADAIKVD